MRRRLPEPPPSPLGRPMDLAITGNRVALTASAAAAAVGGVTGLRRGAPGALTGAARGAAATFGAWAIARELDPPRQETALLALSLGAATSLAGAPSPPLTFGVLIGARALAGTVGLALGPREWPVLAVAGAAVAWGIARMPRERAGRAALATAAVLAGVGAAALLAPAAGARTDVGRRPVAPTRVRIARAGALAVLAGAVPWGPPALGAGGPVLAALAATAVGAWRR